MKREKILIVLAAVLVLNLMVTGCEAIGISPSRTTIYFEPGLHETHEFTVINNGDESLDVELYKKGDLTDYITLYESSSILEPNERKTFSYDMNLPDSLDGYGIFDTRIGAREAEPDSSSMMGGRAGVESQLWIIKLYDGKYAEVDLVLSSVYVGNVMSFGIRVYNFGTESIQCDVILDVLDLGGQQVAYFDLDEISLNSAEFENLDTQWNTEETGTAAGQYRANVIAICDGVEYSDEKGFELISKEDDAIEGTEDDTDVTQQGGSTVVVPQTGTIALQLTDFLLIILIVIMLVIVIVYFTKIRKKSTIKEVSKTIETKPA